MKNYIANARDARLLLTLLVLVTGKVVSLSLGTAVLDSDKCHIPRS